MLSALLCAAGLHDWTPWGRDVPSKSRRYCRACKTRQLRDTAPRLTETVNRMGARRGRLAWIMRLFGK